MFKKIKGGFLKKKTQKRPLERVPGNPKLPSFNFSLFTVHSKKTSSYPETLRFPFFSLFSLARQQNWSEIGTMSVVHLARSQSKKLLKMSLSIFRPRFNSSRCKTWAKMTTARIKLLRNKREAALRQMRRDVALLLESRQDATARIRVEHVIREQNLMAANDIVELFCEHIVARLTILSKQRDCPLDLKEGICSLIYAAARCSDIPELLSIRDIFQRKYGKEFVAAATDLHPDTGVNRLLIEKLSARNPPGELKLKVMKEIAKEYQVEWNTAETEQELLKPPEERIEGPKSFVSASSLPVKPTVSQIAEPNNSVNRLSGGGEMQFKDAASAAKAAAESAKDAIAAAQAAAQLASQDFSPNNYTRSARMGDNDLEKHRKNNESQSFGRLGHSNSTNFDRSEDDEKMAYYRRHSYNVPVRRNSDIKFDESECDEEIEMEPPSSFGMGNCNNSNTSNGKEGNHHPRIHPKLPDYDVLAARFEALKYRKPKT